MKKLFLVLAIGAFVACNDSGEKTSETPADSTATEQAPPPATPDSSAVTPDSPAVATPDTTIAK